MPGLRSALVRRVVLPAGDALFKHGMMARLRTLEETQWWPREQLLAEQRRLLGQLVQVAYRDVPYYRQMFDEARVGPRDIVTPEDLRFLPISTKATLRDAYPDRVTRRTGLPTSVSATSGSTGTNFCVVNDSESLARARACLMLALGWTGWSVGEPHLQTGMTLERGTMRWLKDRALGCRYFSAFDLRDESLDRMLDSIEANRLKYAWGYPSSLYFLAKRALARGWNRPLNGMASWGDQVFPHYREAIEQAFGCKLTDTYGCAEGIQVAAQCGRASHYHVYDLDTIVEYVDDDGKPVAPGQRGALVLTRLYPGPMPLIRYRLGDMGVSGGEAACDCGRGSTLLREVSGRITDVVVTPSGNRLIVHYFTGILEHFPEIQSFQAVQREASSIELRVVPTPGHPIDAAVSRRIVTALQARGAEDLRIDVSPVSEIPLTKGGKRRFVISEL